MEILNIYSVKNETQDTVYYGINFDFHLTC